MRKHISVFMLMVRSCVYKLLLIFLAMAVVETALFALTPDLANKLLVDIISEYRLELVYTGGFALVSIALLGVCTATKAQPRYTLARLSISEKTVMLWHWVCGAMCYLALWFWQIMLLYGLARWHHSIGSDAVISHQSIYLDTFRSDFFHSVLPLEDLSRIARNFVIAICSAGIMAAAAYRLRRGKKAGFGPAFIAALTAGTFKAEYFEVNYDGFLMFAYTVICVISVVGLFNGDPEVDYEEASLENQN